MNVTLNFTLPDPAQLLVYVVIGLVVALLIGGLARLRYFGSYFGTFLLAAIGAWFFASILRFQVLGDTHFYGVPLIEAIIGGLIFGLIGVVIFASRRRVVA
ncbi:MAG: hypothetical protein JWP00_1853 [Chloroflexi bacterium]|jgi:uncharacterized membrane protein YeaQ/YmgE (transglycosylase-associated protein family)|nr:hypothetical protein [Chloroflexota bacterium]